jgi:hypothetical protein
LGWGTEFPGRVPFVLHPSPALGKGGAPAAGQAGDLQRDWGKQVGRSIQPKAFQILDLAVQGYDRLITLGDRAVQALLIPSQGLILLDQLGSITRGQARR